VIVFGFSKGAISGVTPNKRLEAITGQNPSLRSSLRKVKVLKRPQTKSVKTMILRFGDPKAANKTIDFGVL
jgi:hypothetical protein